MGADSLSDLPRTSRQPCRQPRGAERSRIRRDLAPTADAAFHAFSKAAFDDGALPSRTKQIIAVAVAHVTQCPYCITGHTRAALRSGASKQQLMEAIWVAAEMRAGGAFAYSLLALDEMNMVESANPPRAG